jgi:Protein of unknown function (DUF3108)
MFDLAVSVKCIVRRKAVRQRIVSKRVHTNSMTKSTATIAVLAALVCAAAALHWVYGVGPSAPVPKVLQPAPVSAASAIPEREASAAPAHAAAAEPVGAPSAATETTVPFHAGEVLEFAADVAKLSNVANLRLQIVERRNFFGKNAWHLQAFAHTENPLRMMFELDDQFDSYSDATTLASLQYEMHLSERGEKQESIQRMTTTGAERAPADATQTRVLPGTRDPLGMMQYLRTVNWEKVREVRGPVYDGHKLYDVRASYAGSAGNIAVPVGTFDTSKIDLRVFDSGAEMKDAHFTLYLASNPMRTPVLLEAVMPFATARVALVKMK